MEEIHKIDWKEAFRARFSLGISEKTKFRVVKTFLLPEGQFFFPNEYHLNNFENQFYFVVKNEPYGISYSLDVLTQTLTVVGHGSRFSSRLSIDHAGEPFFRPDCSGQIYYPRSNTWETDDKVFNLPFVMYEGRKYSPSRIIPCTPGPPIQEYVCPGDSVLLKPGNPPFHVGYQGTLIYQYFGKWIGCCGSGSGVNSWTSGRYWFVWFDRNLVCNNLDLDHECCTVSVPGVTVVRATSSGRKVWALGITNNPREIVLVGMD